MKPVDKTELGIRFGCGFVFGLLLFGTSSLWWAYGYRGFYGATVFIAAIASGLAALKFGDAFWRWFARWFSWFN